MSVTADFSIIPREQHLDGRIKNTSHGLILKVCDVFFVKAAKTDLTELMFMPSIVFN